MPSPEVTQPNGPGGPTYHPQASRQPETSSLPLPVLADQVRAVRKLPISQLLLPLTCQFTGLARTQARRPGENQCGFTLQTAAVPPGTFLEPPDRLVIQIPNEYLSHGVLS